MTIKNRIFILFGGFVLSVLLSIGLFSFQNMKVAELKEEEVLLRNVKDRFQDELIALGRLSNSPYTQGTELYRTARAATEQAFLSLKTLTRLPAVGSSVREALEAINKLQEISRDNQETLEGLILQIDRQIGEAGIDTNYFNLFTLYPENIRKGHLQEEQAERMLTLSRELSVTLISLEYNLSTSIETLDRNNTVINRETERIL